MLRLRSKARHSQSITSIFPQHVPSVEAANTLGDKVVVERQAGHAFQAEARFGMSTAARGADKTAIAPMRFQ